MSLWAIFFVLLVPTQTGAPLRMEAGTAFLTASSVAVCNQHAEAIKQDMRKRVPANYVIEHRCEVVRAQETT